MKRLLDRLFIVLLLSNFFFYQALGQGRRKPTDTIKGLQLSVKIKEGKKSFRPDGMFRIEIKLTNVGKSPITLYKNLGWGWSSSFFLSITDTRGRMIHSAFLSDAQDHPPFLKENFITIQPGEDIKRERDVGLGQYEIKKPGVFRLIVWYASPVPLKCAPEGMKIWALENGRLESKHVRFGIAK